MMTKIKLTEVTQSSEKLGVKEPVHGKI